MRIAYIANYQGPGLLQKRPIVGNLSLAANVKMELIAELLQRRGHRVEILSQGEVIKLQCKFYPSFREAQLFDPNIPIFYSSALPIRFLNGLWSSRFTLRRFRARHQAFPYDVVIIYNMKTAQIACANYAIRRLGLPVILQYEDDVFVSIGGETENDLRSRRHYNAYRGLMKTVSGGIAVSPHLLSQLPSDIPNLLLRGVVDEDILSAGRQTLTDRKDRVVYCGTHFRSKGLDKLINAWGMIRLPGWELHITGRGELTKVLEKMAQGNKSIVFHGLLDRQAKARLLGSAKIGINPHDVSGTPGNVFAFKIIEYLAAGTHVISTPMGPLEPELEAGITYMSDNTPETIARTLEKVVRKRCYERTAVESAQSRYGPAAVSMALDKLLREVAAAKDGNCPGSQNERAA